MFDIRRFSLRKGQIDLMERLHSQYFAVCLRKKEMLMSSQIYGPPVAERLHSHVAICLKEERKGERLMHPKKEGQLKIQQITQATSSPKAQTPLLN